MMEMKQIEKYIASKDLTIIDAMKKMDDNGAGVLFIVDKNEVLFASLTDGDIRRWLIKTGELDTTVLPVIHSEPKYLDISDRDKAYAFMVDNRIRALPLVDQKKRIKDIVLNSYQKEEDRIPLSNELSNTSVIIMAGGKGTRLYPYTKILPKPLIPVGDVPILERIINRFYLFGVRNFYVTVNYKKEIIKSYFNELGADYKITFVEEEIPLGTAGGISLIKETFNNPVIITNCDTLIEADYAKILNYHNNSQNILTIVSAAKNTVIPYGVLHSGEAGRVKFMDEKPEFSFFINTGMYILESKYLKIIPSGKEYNMTDLANKLIAEGEIVGMYPISENSFLDMGEFAEMKKMEERINQR